MQAETVIHPRARFESNMGSILIGRRCVIHERAHLGIEPKDTANASSGGVTVGDYVIVEVGAQIEAGGTEIGEGSVIQVGSRIGSGAKIGKQNCTVTPRSTIAPGEILPDQTVVYSNGKRRTDKRRILEARKAGLLRQINVVRSMKMIRSDPDRFG
ncbi:Dynactin subunit-like protein [Hapsidospora chrysogenum ATCC 11550]|uniref:Dynactin subunit 6 n=1 Tax=Hapsidospora chrysogenum (strain ATCC 11550 / CBS 779.69 / DSM 880 / IAM 14645 / JCM 23072 / IMI 49137) TaxID=857340 RepID=A0A086T9T4_HAPC1|nr:Dynactin subunit-like protein [Hapsidospora chrysogenum ATCC 11550]